MNPPSITPSQIERIIQALEGLKYGSVVITVHDSHIVQIERTEKHRFPPKSSDQPPNRPVRKHN